MNDMTIGATLPITGSARTPKEMPIASVGSTSGNPARTPERKSSPSCSISCTLLVEWLLW
jgi:hypothetical protein